MITKWKTDRYGKRCPDYTDEQAHRVAEASWLVHFLLPHPDDVLNKEHAAGLREFHRAIQALPPLVEPR